MNPPILVLTRNASLSPFASYLPELLRMEGLNWLSVQECSSLEGDIPLPPLVVLGAVDLDRREAEILASHVRQGGALLAGRPCPALMTALDLPPAKPLPGGWSRGYVVLEEASPVVAGLPWPVGGVQYFGHTLALLVGSGEPGFSGVSSRAPNPSDARGERVAAAAWLAPFSGQPTRFPALVTLVFGAGRVVLFAYDPAECAVVQQQGRPLQASTGALPDFDGDGTFRPSDLFLGQLDPALRDVPQADLQRTLLLRAIEWLTEHRPLPRLWRFPNGAPAAILLDGDSDSMKQEDFDLAIQTCDRYNAPFATYLKTEHIDMLQASDERAAYARGHRFGLHPWAGPKPSVEEFHSVLQHDSAQFAARYGYRPRVMRSHWVVWPGWVDTARTLQAAGIQLDTNFTAGWGFKGGYVNGSGLPARFVDEAGVLLDLYEQSTISGDDSWLLPKAGRPAMTLADAIARSYEQIDNAISQYHTVFHPYFHPVALKGGRAIPYPTLPWLESILAHGRRHNIPFLDAEHWLDWNHSRRSVQLADLRYGESGRDLQCALRGESTVDGITTLIPLPHEATNVSVTLDGERLAEEDGLQVVTRHGRPYAAITCSLRAGDERVLHASW